MKIHSLYEQLTLISLSSFHSKQILKQGEHVKANKILILLTLILTFVFLSIFNIYWNKSNKIHIAVVAPLSGSNAETGNGIVQGVKLYYDEINSNGGINNRKIVIDVYDDKNDENLARKKANEIVHNNKAVAVIGHQYSSASISGGSVYKKHQIPAITPCSTSNKVTKDNEWYFRNVYNDNLQARFLLNYIKSILGFNCVSIIHEDLTYGRYLSKVFEETSKKLDVHINYKKEISTKIGEFEKQLSQIIEELKSKDSLGAIFLAVHAREGAEIIKAIKDANINNLIIGPDTFANPNFIREFDAFSNEQNNPSFYTKGIYVTTPMSFDFANEKAQFFKDQYVDRYQQFPSWHSAFAYDAAMLIAEAIKNQKIIGSRKTLKTDRIKIRNYLNGLNDMSKSIEGTTGFNYFNSIGDSQKPVTIGIYQNNRLIPALTQLQTVKHLYEINKLKKDLNEEKVLLIDGKYMFQTNVVYSGVKFNEISNLNLKELTFDADFNIWFRYEGVHNVHNIRFLNALKDIKLDKPIVKETHGSFQYRMFHVKGRFKADFFKTKALGQHVLSLNFINRNLTRHNLIYVPDVIGMKLEGKHSMLEQMKKAQVFRSASGWYLNKVWFFQDIEVVSSLGRMNYINSSDSIQGYSRLNLGILIKKNQFSLMEIIPKNYVNYIFFVCILLLIFIFTISRFIKDEHSKHLFFIYM